MWDRAVGTMGDDVQGSNRGDAVSSDVPPPEASVHSTP
jgi:hypothetical protein